MKQTATYRYVDDGQAQIVALPLANRELAVVIAVPHPDVSLADYEANLTVQSGVLTPPDDGLARRALRAQHEVHVGQLFTRRCAEGYGHDPGVRR